LVEILSRAFYSMHDTKTPVFIGILAMSLNILFSYVFSWLFARAGWLPHGGLALANSTATGLEALGLLYLMRRRLDGIEGGYIIEGMFKALIATFVMAAALIGWKTVSVSAPVWLSAIGGILIGSCTFAAAALSLKINEFRMAAGYLKKRLAG
jgi:putative peptidoglycan lipid II flippase